MVSSKRSSSLVWCLLLAGLLLSAAEVEAGRVQKQEEEVGSQSGIVLAGIAQCVWDNCQGLEGMKRRVCETECCVSDECQGLSGVDRMACKMKCDNAYGAAAAGSLDMEDGNILQVV